MQSQPDILIIYADQPGMMLSMHLGQLISIPHISIGWWPWVQRSPRLSQLRQCACPPAGRYTPGNIPQAIDVGQTITAGQRQPPT